MVNGLVISNKARDLNLSSGKLKGANMTKLFMGLLSIFMLGVSGVNAAPATDMRIVENDKVCMVTNKYFGKTQLPVEVSGKTYYGCCAGCKKKLGTNVQQRTAVDPVTGEQVDKALAVIGAYPDGKVVYFESKESFNKYSSAP